jgi:hypothetical protein
MNAFRELCDPPMRRFTATKLADLNHVFPRDAQFQAARKPCKIGLCQHRQGLFTFDHWFSNPLYFAAFEGEV